jgi:sugar phosphate isomerase/epimerase
LSTHLKDMRQGTKVNEPTGDAPDETSVVLGEGMVDIAGVIGAATKAGVKIHFIEDEHPESEKQIPRSLEYLASLKL